MRSGSIDSSGNVGKCAALSDSFIDGGSSAPAKAPQSEARRTQRVQNGATAGTARSLRHSQIVSKPPVRTNGRAVQPRLIEEFAGLHVEADGHRVWSALGIGRRPAAVSTTEVLGNPLARKKNSPIAVVIPIAIAIAILVLTSRSGERPKGDDKKYSEDRYDARGPALRRRISLR